MTKARLFTLVLAGSTLFGGAALWAQRVGDPSIEMPQVGSMQQVRPGTQPVISGPDIGFQVSSVANDGTVSGHLLVRVNGEWRTVRNSMAVVPAGR